jgi:hypothetical protein
VSEQIQMEMAGVMLTADGEGLYLQAPCYVARQERVVQCMGSLEIGMQRFTQAILSAQLLVLPWYEGIEHEMEAANLHPFEDAAAYLPSGHRFSVPGVHLRLEAGRLVVRRERISLPQH